MKKYLLIFMLVCIPAISHAENLQNSPEQVNTMLKQLDMRRGDEMNRAIFCEVEKMDLQMQVRKLQDENSKLQSQLTPAPDKPKE